MVFLELGTWDTNKGGRGREAWRNVEFLRYFSTENPAPTGDWIWQSNMDIKGFIISPHDAVDKGT